LKACSLLFFSCVIIWVCCQDGRRAVANHLNGWMARMDRSTPHRLNFKSSTSLIVRPRCGVATPKASTIGDRLRAVKPTVFLGIPRVWEKIADKVKAIGASTKGLKKKVATFAKGRGAPSSSSSSSSSSSLCLAVLHLDNTSTDVRINVAPLRSITICAGLLYNERCLMGGSGKKPKGYFIANKVLGKIAGALGLQECKFALTSAAPIGKETLEYYGSLGISICEAYGMSFSLFSRPEFFHFLCCLYRHNVGLCADGDHLHLH
jgi:long-subunit acyl-CoA synthetase (AMP-forming)